MSTELTSTDKNPQQINPFSDEAWSETPPVAEEKSDTAAAQPGEAEEAKQGAPAEEKQPEAYETLFEKEWGKTPADLKAEYEELVKLREQGATREEIAFANEQSRLVHDYLREGKTEEVFRVLEKQRLLASADTLPAAEAIRLHLKLQNPHYSDLDVQDVFEERYGLAEKPVQTDLETDEEFSARLQKWESEAGKVTRRIERDSVDARKGLHEMKTEIVLPDTKKGTNPQAEADAAGKEDERIRTIREQYLKTLDAQYQSVKGFEAVYKDEEVEFPVSYLIADDEKAAQKAQLENFDVDGFITARWFHPDGSPNVQQLMEDKYLLENRAKVFQKLVNEAGARRFDAHLKKVGNIKLDGKPEGVFNPGGEKADLQKAAEFFFAQ